MIHKALLALALLTLAAELQGAEALPPRALAGIGGHRFYHGPGITCAVLSSDGRYIASSSHDPVIVLWDAATGERLYEMRLPQGASSRLAFSPNCKQLAAEYAISAEKSGVVLFDVETGKLLRRLSDFQRQVSYLQFSARSEQLRVSEWGGPVSAWNIATGKRLRLWKPPPSTPPGKGKAGMSAVQGVLSPDGRVIVWEICGYALGGCAAVWMDGLRVHDAQTNQLLYQKKFRDPDQESNHDELDWSFAFTSDSKRLVADCDKLAVWEAATGKELMAFKIPGMVRFVLAPNGRRAAIEEAATRRGKSRLRLWDIETGKPLRELYSGFEDLGHGFQRPPPVFSADGKTLLIATDSTLRLFDARTGEEPSLLGHRAPILPRFSADGRTLFTSCAERRCRWNISGKEPILLSHEPRKAWEVECLAHSADGQLALDRSPDIRIQIRDTVTGRVLHTLPEYARFADFSPDGTRLLLYNELSERPSDCQLYDVKADRKSGEIKSILRSGRPAFSPNSQLVAWSDRAGDVHLHDGATGKSVRTLRSSRPLPKEHRIYLYLVLLFSPDGEQLVAAPNLINRSESRAQETIKCPLRVFQVSSGREIARFYANPEKASKLPRLSCMACSADGRLIAVGEGGSGIVRLIEIASGKVRAEFAGHRHGVHGLAFSPDGQTLASGGEDNVVFLWDVTGAQTQAAVEKPLAACWNDLASEDAKRAGDAIADLLRKSEASTAFLKDHLRPSELPEEKLLMWLLADLDNDAFEKRAAANRELARLGERAEPALWRALKEHPSLEVRRRIEDLLSKLEPGSPIAPETLRTLRAIEVLEHIGTAEARRCLDALAKGAPQARPTHAAKRALDRLAKSR